MPATHKISPEAADTITEIILIASECPREKATIVVGYHGGDSNHISVTLYPEGKITVENGTYLNIYLEGDFEMNLVNALLLTQEAAA